MRELYTNFRFGLSGEHQDMLVEDGRVVWRGTAPTNVETDRHIDLAGKTVLPAFIDNHCHILPTGLDLGRLNLGACQTREEVLDAVRDRLPAVPDGQWLRAVHYDQTKFADGLHLSRHDLDRISGNVPVLLRHVNGHASVANSAAFQAAGIHEGKADPKGGTYVRDEAGALTGVLLERAHEDVSSSAPKATLEDMIDAIMLAGEKMHQVGITCACDMATGQFDVGLELQAYRTAAERGCKIRTRLYVHWANMFGPRALDKARLQELAEAMDSGTCRIAGVKIFADGAIGSATAAIYGEFEGGGGSGQLIYSPDRLNQMVKTAHEAGCQLAIHSIGDRSTDLVMDAFEQLGDPSRHRIEHAMMMSDVQIERMARLGVFCTMQPEFLMRFGHSYLRQLGPDRRSRLKRARSVIDAGIPLSFSSDRPIVAGDPQDAISILIGRPEGYDSRENISLTEALSGYTTEAAAAMQEEGLGGLEAGQMADFLIADESVDINSLGKKRLGFYTKMAQNLEPAQNPGR